MVNVSHRDQKRRQTANSIHQIAQQMALQNGISKVMIEDIANAAAISRRTFFNYFATKEDAVLGVRMPILTSDARDAFSHSSGSLLERTTRLIIDVYSTAIVPGVALSSHIAVRKKYPELRPRIDYYTTQCEQLVLPVISEYVDEDIDAEIVLRAAGAILRHAYTSDANLTSHSVSNSMHTFLETIKRIS